MIDKIWYDWQEKNPKNKYSFTGGSVEPFPSYVNYTIYPNGLPPYLNVSPSSDPKQTYVIMVSDTLCSPLSLIARCLATVSGPTLRFGI